MDNTIGAPLGYRADHFIRFLLDGKREVTVDEIETRKDTLGLHWLVGPFIVAMIAPVYSSVPHAEKDTVFDAYEAFVRRELADVGIRYVTLMNSYNNIVVLMALDGREMQTDEINAVFIHLHERLVAEFGLEVFIGIGSIAAGYSEIAVSAADAQEMLSFKYQYADSGVVNIATMVQFQHNVSRSNSIAFDRVLGCFMDGDLGKMERRLGELVESIRHRPNVSNTSIRRSLVEVTVQILHAASNADVDVEQVLGTTDPYRWIMRQNHTEIITEWIMKLSSQLLDEMRDRRANEETQVIRQAKRFIDDNLASVDLGLQQVSHAVGLSSTYCSQLFKKEVGMGITTYITQHRLARAQVLLAETALTAAEISKQVGFMSAGYFGQVFRKATGVTPQEYRRTAIKK